jgi:hypothetical protein
MLFRDAWIFMCEGCRVKMGYVTYRRGGGEVKKSVQVERVGLKKQGEM